MISLAVLSILATATPYADIVERYADLDRFSGAVLMAEGDKVLFEGAYGLANQEFGVPNTTDTRFDLGSLSKQFTATAILKLEAEGKLSVSDKISRHLPDYPKPQGDKVSIDNLLDHTSGIPSLGRRDGVQDVDWDGNPTTLAKLIGLSSGLPLQFEPGTEYRYNNTGYAILAAIIESASGQSYSEYLKKHLFDPAQLKNTGVIQAGSVISKMASGYKGYAPNYERPAYVHPSWQTGYAGIYSTVGDLHQWMRKLVAGSILPAAQVQKLFEKHTQRSRPGTFYGYGWFIDTFQGEQMVWHGGTVDGFVCELLTIPSKEFVAVALCNNPAAIGIDTSFDITRRFISQALGKNFELPPKLTKLSSDQLHRRVGKYDFGKGYVLEIVQVDDHLEAISAGPDSWSMATLADQLNSDSKHAAFGVARSVFEGFIAGDATKVAPHVAPNRVSAYDEGMIKARQKMMAGWGRLLKLTPMKVSKDGDGWIAAMRGSFENKEMYMHVELNAEMQLQGDYYASTMPSRVRLLPESEQQYFVDGFRFETLDQRLRFLPDGSLEIMGKPPLVGKKLSN